MENTIPILDAAGKQSAMFELDEAWLEREKGTQAVHDSVVAFLAGMRAGTACTKTRGEVRGGGAKPWRQKGTGRARAGSIRSPIFRGGGVTFGPRPRSFAKKVNRKIQKLALRRAFAARFDEGSVIIVDQININEPKTKLMISFLESIGAGQDVLLVVDQYATNMLLAARNLPGVETMTAGTVNVYWMLLFKKIVFTKAALEAFGSRISGTVEG